ncbi:MAG: hypothetical protein Q7R77_02790 [Candidatus Daviesbacteria bacterium]|nr:hypothetical protein [Candidatus Daviesbacteria bacterium]
MNILLTGKNAKDIEKLLQDFEIVTSNPDIIISYGGDGTLLYSERVYPGVPKLPMRDSSVCKKCPRHGEKFLIKKLFEGKLKIKEYRKLETTILYQTFTALNDFVIRNTKPIHTIRFQVTGTNKLLIGDGVVISTPFGSSGYFKSITGKTFKNGLGLAFNNITEQLPPVFFKENDIITFKLIRGTATLSFDNNPDIFNVDENSEITFKVSYQTAKIYELDSLRCPNCHITRG